MPHTARCAKVRAFAKINLSLLVLYKRPDGYHEIRTVFQTISLADRLEIEFTRARRSSVEVDCAIQFEDNLAARAAEVALEAMGVRGKVRIRLDKRIPVGGGLGGGSSDAAAVLLALPVLAGKHIERDRLADLASSLGSDVPFFLLGGSVAGLGRGEEIYSLPAVRATNVLLVTPGAAVSTPAAYRALDRPRFSRLTSPDLANKMKRFQSLVRALECPDSGPGWKAFCENDFEAAVFPLYPELLFLREELLRLGADLARLSGSGSALFGVFPSRARFQRALRALRGLPDTGPAPVRFVSRAGYRSAWLRWLAPFVNSSQWPPRG